MEVLDLRKKHIEREPKSFFWCGNTLEYWGDSIENFKVIPHKNGYELARKLPVKYGLQSSHWFDSSFKFVPSTDDNISKIKGV